MKWTPLLFLLAGSLCACSGLQVDRLSLTDPRLPVDARRWVADAEDAVVVSRARRNAADAELRSARDADGGSERPWLQRGGRF